MKKPQVNPQLDWRDWWRMPSHEHRDVPQHLLTYKFMARRTTGTVESNIKVPSVVVLNAVSSIQHCKDRSCLFELLLT